MILGGNIENNKGKQVQVTEHGKNNGFSRYYILKTLIFCEKRYVFIFHETVLKNSFEI
jgi:hypothetical protein